MNLEVVLNAPPVSKRELEDLLDDIIPDGVEIVVADPGYMRVLNRKYRRVDRSTDVLSFDMADSPEDRPEGVVYVDGRLAPPVSELLERILHGFLHLCGMSHDDEDTAAEMNGRLGTMMETLLSGGETS